MTSVVSMISHVAIGPNGRGGKLANKPKDLTPEGRMVLAIEQWLFYSYLEATTESNLPMMIELKKSVDQYESNIPWGPEFTLGREIIQTIKDRKPHLMVNEIFHLFDTVRRPLTNNDGSPQFLSISQEFLDIYFAAFTGYISESKYPDSKIYNSGIYLPSICCNFDDSAQHIYLERLGMGTFDGSRTETRWSSKWNLCSYLSGFDYIGSGKTIDDLIGIFASFSLEHSRYVMTGSAWDTYRDTKSIADVCYDLVVGSNYTATNARVGDANAFFQLLRYLVDHGRISTELVDSQLFGELLSAMRTDTTICAYFKKPLEQISATEAFAFGNSELAKILSARVVPGMEAFDADPPLGDVGEEEDPDKLEVSEDEPEEKIDPKTLLLKLSDPSTETLSDFLYRKAVYEAITRFITNPSTNTRPNDVLLLKRWRARWINLVSISTVRDFVAHLSVRLTDV